MESPTSDFGSNGDLTPSDASTPSTVFEPFEPRFKVKVTEPVKDGERITYTIKVTKVKTEQELSVWREYEDFEWLHHCLHTLKNAEGLLIPPLPARPPTDAAEVASRSKRQLGASSRALIGDQLHRDCRALQTYLRQVAAHAVLGADPALDRFLVDKDAPQPAGRRRPGLLGKLTSSVDMSRKAAHRDIDEFFQRERERAAAYSAAIKEAAADYDRIVVTMQRVASAYGHLATALTMGGGLLTQGEANFAANRLLTRFSAALEDAKHGAEVDIANDQNALGFHLDLYARYAHAVKEMHYRRVCLMVAYEDANRALSKAKPNKLTQAEEAKLTAERVFEECSGIARRELEVYRQERVMAMRDALTTHAEAKIKTARDTYALLAKALSAFKRD